MIQQELLTNWLPFLSGAFFRVEILPDGGQRLAYITDNVYDYCGLSATELTAGGFDRFTLVHPDDVEYVKTAVLPNQIEPLKEIRFRLVTKGGQIKTLISRSITRWVDGSARWREGTITDVTEQTERELALKVQRQFLEWVAQTAKIGGWEIDVTRMTLHWSPEVCRIREADECREVTLSHALEDYSAEGKAKLEAAIQAAIEKGTPWDLELPMVTAKGNKKWIRDVGIPEFVNGKCIHIKGVLQDISDSKLLHHELEEFKEAVGASSILSIADVKGNILFANQKFEQISQYSQLELVGRKHNIVNSGYHPKEFWTGMWRTISSGNAWRGEVRNKRKDGSFYWVDTFIMPLKGSGDKVDSYLSIRNDITEKKENESILKLSLKKAEESDRLKSAFLANVSHELRTPMNAIMGLTELLERNNLSETNRFEFAKLIYQRGKDLLDIVNDILDMSRIETNQISLIHSPGNINELFEKINTTFHPQIPNLRGKNIVLRSVNDLPPAASSIEADFTRLNLVLSHLINNACKFTEKGVIEYGCRLLDSKTLIFHVKDTGIGIAADQLMAIFEPFRRTADPGVHAAGGSGLGLAISKGLIELWGGKIWVDSKPEVGSVFYFTLQYLPLHNSSHGNETGELVNWSGKKVLHVEDDLAGATLLTEMLDSTGLSVLHVASGADAIERLADVDIDLVLLDLSLPDMDGTQVSKVAQRQKIPVVVISAYGDTQTRKRCHDMGLNHFLAKPITRKQLLGAVRQVLTPSEFRGP